MYYFSKENEDTMNIKNMKRESKAYSFKEQQEEIMLRKEIEAKKIKEGKIKKPELSPKQKEAMAIELEKESTIRNRLKSVSNSNFYKYKFNKIAIIKFFKN